MIHKVKTTWKDKMAFDSQIDNHTLRIDTASPLGDDTGPRRFFLCGQCTHPLSELMRH